MGAKGTSEEAFLASEISTKNNGWVGWVWGRQPVVTQLSSALVPEPRSEQLVVVLAIEQLSRDC
jgi:steroid 5-alpha reductase family enzyme